MAQKPHIEETTTLSGETNDNNCAASSSQIKSKVGRPKGSSRFSESDRYILVKTAEAIVRDSDLKPTAYFRRLGISEENDIRRLQTKWRRTKAEFLRAAQLDYDAQLELGLFGGLKRGFLFIGELVDAFTGSEVMQAIRESQNRAARVHAAHKKLGLYNEGPVDPGDLDQVNEALARFEARPYIDNKSLTDDLPEVTLAELSPSAKMYISAVLLHELSLQAYEAEIAEGKMPSLPIVKDKTSGAKS